MYSLKCYTFSDQKNHTSNEIFQNAMILIVKIREILRHKCTYIKVGTFFWWKKETNRTLRNILW